MSRDELLPLLEVPFEDATIFVPNKYDVVLTRGYGNYMELPPKEDRKNHHPAVLDFGQY
jgi:lipopolysaccharide cholinephosphotransferase